MFDKGQHEIFNFDTPDSDFEFAIENKGSISGLLFTRKRPGKPDDTVYMWLKTEWITRIKDQLMLEHL